MSPTIVLLVAVSAAALSVFMLTGAFVLRSTGKTGVARSLELIEHVHVRHEVAKQDLPARERLVDPVLRAGLGLGRRLTPSGQQARLQHRLDIAGNPGTWTPERVLASKGAGLLVGVLLGAFMLLKTGVFPGLAWLGGFAAVGFWMPDLLLYNSGLKRQQSLQRSTPDALDMLTVCVEAGLGFDAALAHVARNTSGPIAGEFARILQEMQIGKSRVEAFQALTERTTVPELHTLVSALVQADKLGIPVANVLRSQAHEMRTKRRQRAEEQAQKVPVKILFPLVLCVFPALFVVILGPAGIQIARTFMGIGG
ncbi:type II secretion system F family protein [Angustibacter speluncae]